MEIEASFLLQITAATAEGLNATLNNISDEDLILLGITREELKQCVMTLRKFVETCRQII